MFQKTYARLLIGLSLAFSTGLRADDALKLWYRQPAAKWEEALPIGNGRLGAMVFGGTTNEKIQLNENTLLGNPCVLPYGDKSVPLHAKPRQTVRLGANLQSEP